jgi:hypothetical protein
VLYWIGKGAVMLVKAGDSAVLALFSMVFEIAVVILKMRRA